MGADTDALGEVVFNTGMTGYQEILSDPSYSGQLVTMTCPEIGNTGINSVDMESSRLFANGFILHEMNMPSNWRAELSLGECLRGNAIPAVAGIDTRALASKLREHGTIKGYISVSGKTAEKEAIRLAVEWGGLDGQDYAAKVSCKQSYRWDETGKLSASWGIADRLPAADLKIVAYDFGIKWNILRSLRLKGMDVTVVPAKTSAEEVLKYKPDGVFLSNGPADPAGVPYAVNAAKELIGKVPIMGICLGHQLLGMACGGERFRLKFGHHGCNHPVQNLENKSVEITSQNHNFAIEAKTMPSCLEITHMNLNDNTVEGISHKTEPMFAVQYHPEAGPGPHDPYYLFEKFRKLMSR
ncbi:MAG: carbamoyl-phosphate synthase small subunit [Candidatus Moranbacteria bacterium]|nr:carbamoyl-phosphate synthase small subunit [Candidatus Moranbacteria bacterium]